MKIEAKIKKSQKKINHTKKKKATFFHNSRKRMLKFVIKNDFVNQFFTDLN